MSGDKALRDDWRPKPSTQQTQCVIALLTWQRYRRFHHKYVSILPYETWNAHRARATIELLERETPERVGNTARECVQNTHHWSGRTERTEWANQITLAYRQLFLNGDVTYQHASRPVVDILSTVSDFRHCTVCVSGFCCRYWRHEQLRATFRPILAYCPFWGCDVVM